MAEGREKLVEEGDEKRRPNGAPNGRAHTERDSGKTCTVNVINK